MEKKKNDDDDDPVARWEFVPTVLKGNNEARCSSSYRW
jgi:hypothetical protein